MLQRNTSINRNLVNHLSCLDRSRKTRVNIARDAQSDDQIFRAKTKICSDAWCFAQPGRVVQPAAATGVGPPWSCYGLKEPLSLTVRHDDIGRVRQVQHRAGPFIERVAVQAVGAE